MNSKNVLIWGSTGTIGSEISYLIKKNAIFSLAPDLKDYGLRFGESCKGSDARLINIDVLVIACGPRDEDLKDLDFDDYLLNVEEFIDCLPEHIHIVYISTARVYEGQNIQNINEDTETIPISEYAKIHVAIEHLFMSKTSKCTVLRPQAVYNYMVPRPRRSELIVNSFPALLKSGQNINLKSKGDALRNFVSSVDVAKVVVEAINGTIYGVIHPVGCRTLSVENYKEMVENLYKVIVKKEQFDEYPYNLNERFPSRIGYHSVKLKQFGSDIFLDTINLFRS
jgi:nucleoside-diphosphate-sugar epimerase